MVASEEVGEETWRISAGCFGACQSTPPPFGWKSALPTDLPRS